VLILLGTGWGIAYRELGNVDYFLPPIEGIGDFNHLSVRSAASIVLDRIISQYKEL
jgi:tRNA (guanine37-N1)-methyltransferase